MNITITLVIQGLAFFAVAWVVMTYGWPHIMAAIEERQKKIADGLAAADRAQRDLQAADQRIADEIRKARAEATTITERAHVQANQIVDKAKGDAISEAQAQKAMAEAEIANLSHQARDVLRRHVGELAVKGAEKILRREIDPARHRDLIDQLASEI